MNCENCDVEISQGSLFCTHCGKPTEPKEMKEEKRWTPIEGNGEKFGANCGFCNEYIFGKAWSVKTLEEMVVKKEFVEDPRSIFGFACGNCGFIYCFNRHQKELKMYGIKLFKLGDCPQCRIAVDVHNKIFVYRIKEEELSTEGCMFCGANKKLEEIEIWSGEMVAGDSITSDITWMGLVVLIPGKRAVKVIDVQSKKYRVCEKCSAEKVPESFTEFTRKKNAELSFGEKHFVAQREPFSEEFKLGQYKKSE